MVKYRVANLFCQAMTTGLVCLGIDAMLPIYFEVSKVLAVLLMSVVALSGLFVMVTIFWPTWKHCVEQDKND